MEIDVFVSHHTASSINIVEAIVNKLESNGIRCWYAPRNTKGAYGKSIAGAIDSCKIFLLILNKPASESEHVLNELELIFDRVSNKEDVSILPFHIADEMSEISREAQYYIRRQHWIDAMTPPIYQRIDELVDKMLLMLNKTPCAITANSSSASNPEYKLISKIPTVRDVFIGREVLLEEISEFFKSGKRILFLEGIGGIGKSELAKQYAIKNRQMYDNILFLTYSEDLRSLVCDNGLIEISGISIGADENEDDFFLRKLKVLRSITNSRTLLIIDNFDVDDDVDFKEFTQGSCNIIFTTRNSHPAYSTIKVKSIDDESIILDIFEKNYGMAVSETDKPYLLELFKLVDYHTYTIELLAKQMEASFVSGQELLEMFKNGQLANEATEDIQGRNSVKTAFDHIKSLFSINSLSEVEIQILRELSLVGHDGVPVKYFLKWSVSDTPETIKKTILGLVRRSWVRRENAENGARFSLHPLVSEVIRASSDIKPNARNCRSFLDKVYEDLYNAWVTPYTDNLSITGCVMSIAEYFSPYNFEANDKNLLCIWTGIPCFLWQVGKFNDSIRICHVVYETCLRICGEGSMLTGHVAKALGGCYFNSRRAEESIKWYKQGLQSMILSGHEENEDLAMSYEKVARCYTWEYEQDFEKAEEYFKISNEIRLRLKKKLEDGGTVSNVEPYLVYTVKTAEELSDSYLELAKMYRAKKDYEKSIEYLSKQEEKLLRITPDNISSLAFVYYEKGICFYNLGLIDESPETANPLFENAIENLLTSLDLNLKMRGGLAIDTIDSAECLADAYAAIKKYSEASNYYMLVLTMLENLFGKEHERIDIVKAKMNFQQ